MRLHPSIPPPNKVAMMKMILRLFTLALVLSVAWGAPASPNGRIYKQPDGSETPMLFLKGDQHYAWMADGNTGKDYTVLKDKGGWWVYAKKEDGELVSSGVRVGKGNPKKLGIEPELKTDLDRRPVNNLLQHDDGTSKDHRELINVPDSALCNYEGTTNNPCRLRGLVVLIRFADHADVRCC